MKHNARKTFTKKQIIEFLSLLCYCLTFFSCTYLNTDKREKSYDILIIYSQHPDEAHWIEQLEQGFLDCLTDKNIRANIQNVYLEQTADPSDTISYITSLRLFLDSLSVTPPDLILTDGDKTTHALFSTRHPLAEKIPVVFSGVDYLPRTYLANHKNATGFLTTPDFYETQRLASQIMGFRQNQRNVIDGSPIGLLAIKEISDQFQSDTSASAILGPVWQPLPPDSVMGWKEEIFLLRKGDPFGPGKYMISIKLLDENDGTMLFSQTRYINKNYFTTACWNKFTNIIVEGRIVPFFSVNDEGFGRSYIGGYFTPSYKQAYQAMNLGIRILKGAKTSSFEITTSPKEYMFDWEMLQYWSIPIDLLPSGSTIVNWPFKEKYKILIYASGVIISLLLLYSLIILIQLSRKERQRKKQSARMLKTEEQRLATTLDSLKEAIITINQNYQVIRMNKTAHILLNIPEETDLQKLPIDSLCDITTANNPSYLKQCIDAAQQTGKTQWFDRLTYLVTPNKHAFPVSGCITPIKQNANQKEVILTFRNTLEEMTLSEFLELGIAAGETYPWRFDETGQFILFNKNFFSNYKSPLTAEEEDRLLLSTFISWIHPDDRPLWDKAVKQVLDENMLLTIELRLCTPNRIYLWTEFTISTHSVLSPQGIFRQPFGLCTNINNLRNKQEKLQELLEKAKASDENKTLFLANMSHEIRTPLNAIVGFSTLLAESDDLSAEDQQTFIDLINENSQSLLITINDILELSRIESGISFQQIPLVLNDLIHKVKGEQIEKLPPTIQFRLNLPEEPVTILGDSFRLWQVLSNLVSNAIKFTRKGSIEIGLIQTSEEVTLYVQDTGIGISAEQQKKIFERFYRADNFIKGNGLGLSICQEIAQRMQGRITVESSYGKGTTFYLTLPATSIPEVSGTNTL